MTPEEPLVEPWPPDEPAATTPAGIDDRTTGTEPASVTAARQLAADSRDRRRRLLPRAPGVRPFARGDRGTTAGRPTIRPLGRPGAEHPDVTRDEL